MPRPTPIRFGEVHSFAQTLFEDDLHAKRVFSVANATLGIVYSASLAIHAIGCGLAAARGLKKKHAVKQVDRLLSNTGVDVWALFARWVPFVVGARKEIVVALDWTEHDPDDHATLALNLITSHGRATPLLWRTVVKSTLAGNRNTYEDELLERLREGSMHVVVMRDAITPPESRTASCTRGHFRDPGSPTGSVVWSPTGATREGRPKRIAELRSGFGLVHSTDEAAEGNEACGRKGPARGDPARGRHDPDSEPGRRAVVSRAGE